MAHAGGGAPFPWLLLSAGESRQAAAVDELLIAAAFWALLAGVIVSLALGVYGRIRRRRRQEARERRRLEAFLAERGLEGGERELLDTIALAAEEPLARVARLVLSFDRGVNRRLQLLARDPAARSQEMQRIGRLRGRLTFHRVSAGVALLSSREIEVGQELLIRTRSREPSCVLLASIAEVDELGLVLDVLGRTRSEGAGGGESGNGSEGGIDRAAAPQGEEGEGKSGDDLWEDGAGSSTDPLSSGEELEVFFLREEDGGYRFRTVVHPEPGAPGPGGEPRVRIAHPHKLAREHRRHYFRIPILEPVRFACLGPELEAFYDGSAAEGRQRPLSELVLDTPGTVMDLSGSGLRLSASRVEIEPNDWIAVGLPFLDPDGPASRDAPGWTLLARCVKVYRNRAEFGCAFEGHSEEEIASLRCQLRDLHERLRWTLFESGVGPAASRASSALAAPALGVDAPTR